MRYGARQTASVRQRRSEPLAAKDLRRLLQLVACGMIFVALVAAKLLLPARMAGFNEKLSAAMEWNMDVQAVFSAVGRAFSGEGMQSVEEVYQAVFRPQEAETAPKAASGSQAEPAPQDEGASLGTGPALTSLTAEPGTLRAGTAMDVLRTYREAQGTSGSLPEPAEAAETPDASNLAYVLYSQENLPERVNMEQVILGFDYGAPVKGAVLSSDFGYREHPVEGEERFHYGVDLAAEEGTEVLCFAGGTVTAVGESSSYGRYCIVAHEGGYSTLYAHCSRVTVSSGTAVSRGEKLGEVGQTGMATGPHLHFELQCQGNYLNPIYYVSAL